MLKKIPRYFLALLMALATPAAAANDTTTGTIEATVVNLMVVDDTGCTVNGQPAADCFINHDPAVDNRQEYLDQFRAWQQIQ